MPPPPEDATATSRASGGKQAVDGGSVRDRKDPETEVGRKECGTDAVRHMITSTI